MKTELANFEDIVLFVNSFYDKVQSDELIGPIFSAVITDWQPHLEKMYNFWNAALFGVPGFKGNPFAKHAPLSLEKQHFERWLLLFRQTIDTYFEGTMAEETKKKADMMAIMFLSKIENMKGGADKVILV
ncbi:group III truncated hemoglobin [Pedobacter heparinus]|uniref:Globin n=1 Tax=Pedobacter heparinus (strain ATCC 13125 / DSM 2366 / CIP 104194 / JCM 7457 / NBRC 12017 / NCIMB 9290 / NRRL B-14731 / HIM 762-3) TaxID=485917 RepID=C6XVI0_PEDHD|nr:group III truncated hemoglobin [Pedobacter heparinus]ACU04046.1 globin [Pedobacter heparinus DSM 2366]